LSIIAPRQKAQTTFQRKKH